MKAHAELKPLLKEEPGQKFLEAISILNCPWSDKRICLPKAYYYQVFEEFPLPKHILGEDGVLTGSKQIDAMIHINYRKGALYYGDGVQIMVEIKQTRKDLLGVMRGGDYFSKYLGASDFLYLATTPELLTIAEDIVRNIPDVGLFDITSGRIYKLARRQQIADSQRMKNYQTMLCYYRDMPNFINAWLPAVSIGLSPLQPYNMDDEYGQPMNKSYFASCYNARFLLQKLLKEIPAELKLKEYYERISEFMIVQKAMG